MSVVIDGVCRDTSKRGNRTGPGGGKQVNFRASNELHARLVRVADVLGSDVSGIVKQLLHEFLPDYESRAEQINAKRPQEVGRSIRQGDAAV